MQYSIFNLDSAWIVLFWLLLASILYACTIDTSNLQVWNWENYEVPENTWPKGTSFAKKSLMIDAHFSPGGVSRSGDKLRFYLNPLVPECPPGATYDFNMRSEIRTIPWQIQHPLGTEQWIGWRYIFGSNYRIDPTSPIIIYQNHPGIRGEGPMFNLEIAALNRPRPALGGEIQGVNRSADQRIVYPPRPRAGDTLDVVVHVVFDQGENGLLQVWLNDTLQFDHQGSTVLAQYPWGGNNKWGIYHHTHRYEKDVLSSRAAGVTDVEIIYGAPKITTTNSKCSHLQRGCLSTRGTN